MSRVYAIEVEILDDHLARLEAKGKLSAMETLQQLGIVAIVERLGALVEEMHNNTQAVLAGNLRKGG